MVDEVKVIAPRTQERAEALADALLDLLLEKVQKGLANASEMKVAADYIKEAGIKLIVAPGTKAGELVKNLPNFDDDGKVLRFK